MKRKVWIPYDWAEIGGPSSFLSSFKSGLVNFGFSVSARPNISFDTLFIMSACPLSYVILAKLLRRRIVQRLDGVYHPGLPGRNGRLYWFKNLRAQIIHNYLANHIIYQSQFSQKACHLLLGKPSGQTSIIYNAIAYKFPARAPISRKNIRLITFANWRRLDQIDPIIKVISLLPDNFTLDIAGPASPSLQSVLTQAKSHSRITYLSKIPHEELLLRLNQYDIFLFSDQSACPHSVLEALAAGLPVVAFDRGASAELVQTGQTGEIIPLPPHNPFKDSYQFSDQDISAFTHAITKTANNLVEYQKHTSEHQTGYHDMLQAYANLL